MTGCRSWRAAGVAAALLLLGGCAAGTRSAGMGLLPTGDSLVTLVVTEDRDRVREECRNVFAVGRILGCQMSRAVTLPDGASVRAMTIVRYTDALPSAMAFEIDLHELCHAIATLQPLDDPCHIGNDGIIRSAVAPPIRIR